jgi:isoleucyl-tRNA synthetase
LDVTITPALKEEGIARELINRIQNLRKEKGLEVTDKIELSVQKHNEISEAILNNNEYICSETLAIKLNYADVLETVEKTEVDIADDIKTFVSIQKASN